MIMAKVGIEQRNRIDIDAASAKNYIADMVSQLHEIAEIAGLQHEATLLYATSLAISHDRLVPRDQKD